VQPPSPEGGGLSRVGVGGKPQLSPHFSNNLARYKAVHNGFSHPIAELSREAFVQSFLEKDFNLRWALKVLEIFRELLLSTLRGKMFNWRMEKLESYLCIPRRLSSCVYAQGTG
ncbi:hypothetical protein PIB30_099328, partial [Stylosanthes scabra]|nr:hypothetical protein [Stylosanthes scabra]